MKHLDLFSGIGGFSLGFEAEGFETIAFCENDPIKTIVLKHWWPDVPILPDVRDTAGIAEFCRQRGPIDVVTAGVPCQPTSSLGQMRGIADERWLWPETIRLVGAIRPRYCVFENPPALLTLDGGRAFNGIVSGLVALGYDCLWDVFPAAAVGAGHLRERVMLIARNARDTNGGDEGAQSRISGEHGIEPIGGSESSVPANHPRREAHGRNGRSLDAAPGRGEGFDPAADSGGQADVADAYSVNGRHGTGGKDWPEADNSHEESFANPNRPRLQRHAGDETGRRGGAE